MNLFCDGFLPENMEMYGGYTHEETLASIHLSRQHKKSSDKERPDKSGNGGPLKTHSALTVFNMRQDGVKRAGSFVVGQKLRESKWFNHTEMGIFCAVVESGFIIEHKNGEEVRYGVAVWSPGFEKSKNQEYLTIYTMAENKGKYKVLACTSSEFWPGETTVRINNKCDKSQTPLGEDAIRNQITFAQNSKRKWHNTEHFAYFCRYGPVEANVRIRKITDHLRINTGSFFLKIRSLTAK